MWPLPLVIGVAVAGAVVLLITGITLAIIIERSRHRRLLRNHGLNRGLSTYHRQQLSINDENYAQVPQPAKHLRQSQHLPYNIISVWNTVPSEEQIRPEMATIEEGPREEDIVLAPKRRRSLRQTLQNHSVYVPKTRRQRKLQKAMPLNNVTRSPLSAITEFTDSTGESSPALAELQTETTPQDTPEKAGEESVRYPTLQWPIPMAKTRAQNDLPVEIAAPPARTSISSVGSIHTPKPTLGSRSTSVASTTSMAPSLAPDDPLPPLPNFDERKHQRQNVSSRMSVASIDTVGSSVLGTVMSSPQENETGLTIPHLDAHSAGLQTFDFGLEKPVTQRVPAKKQTIHGLTTGGPTVASFRGIMNLSPNASTKQPPPPPLAPIVVTQEDESFKTIDASAWAPALSHRNSWRSSRSPSSLTPTLAPPKRVASARHSMFENGGVQGKRASSGCQPATSELLHQSIPPRPASVASSHPAEGDQNSAREENRLSMNSPDSRRKGHKRQNCVRITNLPTVEPRRTSRMMQMPEVEEEQVEPANTKKDVKIPGLALLEEGQSAIRGRGSLVNVKRSSSSSPTPSLFHNKPILAPTSNRRPPYTRAWSS